MLPILKTISADIGILFLISALPFAFIHSKFLDSSHTPTISPGTFVFEIIESVNLSKEEINFSFWAEEVE